MPNPALGLGGMMGRENYFDIHRSVFCFFDRLDKCRKFSPASDPGVRNDAESALGAKLSLSILLKVRAAVEVKARGFQH
jgi:hypothetical protein